MVRRSVGTKTHLRTLAPTTPRSHDPTHLNYYHLVSHLDHKATSPNSVSCYVLTISDTRTAANDTSGRAIAELLEAGGHHVSGRGIVRDDPGAIRAELARQYYLGYYASRRPGSHRIRVEIPGRDGLKIRAKSGYVG